MKDLRDLFVKFTEDELQLVVDEHSDVCSQLSDIEARAKAASAAFRAEAKPLKERRAELEEMKSNGGVKRPVECEWRDSLVNGQIECVRLDTGEVVDTQAEAPAEESPQGSLFSQPRPDAPRLLCTALNDDGECWAITAEQADAAEREITESGSARVQVDGDTHTVTKVLRGRACDTCGIVAPHHRPECASMRAEDEGDACRLVEHGFVDPEPDSYDPNDTAQVAQRIAEVEPPPDGPVRGGDQKLVPTKPKRSRKSPAQDGVH